MIRLDSVTKVYEGGTVAVRNVDLDVGKGEFVFLVGPSGSGKSTLIRLLLREEDATNGTILVAGKDITKMPTWKVPFLRRTVGTVFQDFKLLPNKTVSENVAFALEVLGRPRNVITRQVEQVLKLVGLEEKGDRLPRQLSGGEQQRVSVARAFVNRPPILLADEPTGNLDPATSVGIMRLLDRINRTGTTIVMATHDHAIVDAMRKRVVQLDDGSVIRDQRSGRYEGRHDGGGDSEVKSSSDDSPSVAEKAASHGEGSTTPPADSSPAQPDEPSVGPAESGPPAGDDHP